MAVHADIMKEDTGIDKDGGGKLSYAEAVKDREKIEEQIGLSLAKNARIPNIASQIHEKSRITLEEKDKKEIAEQANKFGGARASQEGVETLGRYVFETMHHIEKDKAKYSTSRTADHPYFPIHEKKPEFDEPLANLKWNELPPDAKIALDDNKENPFKKLPACTYDELDLKGKLTLLKGFRYKDDRKWAPSSIRLCTGGHKHIYAQ